MAVNTTLDAVVIGAGPAGSSAAIVLSSRGARVALLEAERFPREKLCGEFLSPEIPTLLTKLGARSRVESLAPVEISRVRMTAPEGTIWERRLPRPGWGLSRSAFDLALMEQAESVGAHILTETQATNVHGDVQRGFEIETTRGTLHSRAVIATHGKRASLDRVLRRSFLGQPHPFIALKAHHVGRPLDGRVELHTFPGGYCGLAEIESNRVNVCLLVRDRIWRAATRDQRDPIHAFITWMETQNSYLHDWLCGAERVDERWLSIAAVSFVNKTAIERDILMAGDAGGLIAPVSGDGIGVAIRSGMMAAQECTAVLAGDFSPRRYPAQWKHTFRQRFLLGRLLQAILLEPRLAPSALHAADACPALADLLITRTRDRV